ncbi:MAG: hypothetical protein A2064_13165 [Spirochaetes bacterium GWB1_66_5]|nr:MAG: hypothetical protein A2064_13165 [Spirochaetes bacterium GWB1_66_5]
MEDDVQFSQTLVLQYRRQLPMERKKLAVVRVLSHEFREGQILRFRLAGFCREIQGIQFCCQFCGPEPADNCGNFVLFQHGFVVPHLGETA